MTDDVWLPERRPDGRWLVRWTDKDGKRRRQHCDTYEDALAAQRRYNKGRMRSARPYQPRRREPGVGVSPRTRWRVLERSGFRCVYCGRGAPEVTLHVDHVLPVAEGGTSVETNLVAACDDCNLGKSDAVIASPGDTGVILNLQRHIAELTAHAETLEDLLSIITIGLQIARGRHGYCDPDNECRGCTVTRDATALRLYMMGMGRRPPELGPDLARQG